MSDEMYIRKQFSWDKHARRMTGTVDFCKDGGNEAEAANQVLVYLVTSVNGDWKIPIGYFKITSLKAPERAQLATEAINFIDMAGVEIVAYVFDGNAVNLKAAEVLGASFQQDEEKTINPYFKHPKIDSDIATMIDICHCLKLIRNATSKIGNIEDIAGRIVDWDLYPALLDNQLEGLNLGTKLTVNHTEFEDQKMKVYLAAQLFSSRVAKGLEYMMKVEKDPHFAEAAATIEYTQKINDCFDLLNTRNLTHTGFKKV